MFWLADIGRNVVAIAGTATWAIQRVVGVDVAGSALGSVPLTM